jgi:putative ABC transport system permease protein
MTTADLVQLTVEGFRAHRMRYGLSALAIVIGVAAVVLLSSIGEGTRLAIVDQFSQFGTTIIGVHTGKTETSGIPMAAIGGAVRPLSLGDARALARVPGVTAIVPVSYGSANVQAARRARRVEVYGVTADMPVVWRMPVRSGQFIPRTDFDRRMFVAVLGTTVARELFPERNPVGSAVRIGETRFRVIGVMESKGDFLGTDLDDAVYIPVANALQMFNKVGLVEVDCVAASPEAVDAVAERIRLLMIDRHQGREDVTIVTQADALAVIDRILGIVTTVVAAIAGISLFVGGIGILTVMWIVVNERETEIGLVKAVGASRRQILRWYLFEAAVVALAGGVAGLAAGWAGGKLLAALIPGIATATPATIVAAALLTALAVGLLAGIGPAVRAARLDPLEALRGE